MSFKDIGRTQALKEFLRKDFIFANSYGDSETKILVDSTENIIKDDANKSESPSLTDNTIRSLGAAAESCKLIIKYIQLNGQLSNKFTYF